MADPGFIPPRQERSERTLARILDATLALLVEGDLESLAMEDIARKAGVSVGALYRRFRRKDDLLAALLRKVQSRQLAELREVLRPEDWKDADLECRLAWIAERQRAATTAAPGLVRAIFESVLRTPLSPDEDSVRMNQEALDLLVAWLMECRAELGEPDPETAVRLALMQLLLCVHTAVLHPLAFAPLPPDEAVHWLAAHAAKALRGAR